MGRPARALDGEEVVPGEVAHGVDLAQHPAPARQDRVAEPEHVGIDDDAPDARQEQLVVDGGEELLHVAREHVAVTAGELLAAVQRGVGALADAVGVAVVDEAALEDGFDHVAQGVVHHAVAEGRCADEAALGFVDEEAGVAAGPVAVLDQLRLDRQQVLAGVLLEGGGRPVAALAFARLAPGQQQVLPVVDLRIEVAIDLTHGPPG